ncbi:P-loop containing nucleoside triphosphate hydrolase protein [Collybia nuda]|uniref:P-loop containing nucleoside triphosphate hydrolase protein n=1 Tax=Collybia nuda TaxID=64659 RepID=A0A9P5Y9T6_9AGAR|nr:P-loop containing nucleoside triphosphate hydrolase protein [Collybia nuda]
MLTTTLQKTKESLDPIFQDACSTDLVIPVMGPPGVGKSTFINSLCGRDVVEVGYGLKTCTQRLKAVTLKATKGPFKNHCLVIVDTPPFNSTATSDLEILRCVADCLASFYRFSHRKHMKLAGMIYLYEISQEHMTLGNCQDRELFQKICGNEALVMVVVGATKWEQLDGQAAQKCIDRLKGIFWDDLSREEPQICRVRNTHDGAWDIVNRLAQGKKSRTTLQIQRELVDQNKLIRDTEAGRYVKIWGRNSNRASLAQHILIFFGAKSV